MDEIKIEKNIPIPDATRNGLAGVLRQMEVGDSILLPNKMRSNVSGYSSRIGIKVAVRKIDESSCRVWRIE